MKNIKLLNAVLILFLLISGTIKAADSGDGKTKTFGVKPGGLLNVDLQVGDIKIRTWDKDGIQIKVEGLGEDAFKNLETNLKGNELTVRYENDGDETEDEVTFSFTVPSKFNLDLKTMGGNISLKNNITGNVSIDTYGGEIDAKDIYGSAKIETKGGDIKLNEINGDCSVNTYGGDISITLINDKNAKVSTSGGDITIKKTSGGVSVKTYGGNITVGELGGDSELITYGGDVSVGDAKGNIKMDTYGGNLELKSAKGKVIGKTNGGDIIFKNVDGSVDLKTMSGTIAVGLNPSPNSESRISTNSGSIELTLSESAKTTVEARIHVQGWWKNTEDDYNIYSDFDSQSYTTDEDTHDIVGIYKINGGGSRIILKSVNDEIQIKKAVK
jgi:DUF4097 and DUF4098 domain-containing protein YvlB